jgi:helicase
MQVDFLKPNNLAQQFILESLMLETGFSCVLQLPTGAGKTWLAKTAIRKAFSRGMRAIYLTPLRALADELHQSWEKDMVPAKVGIFTGDYSKEGGSYPVSYAKSDVMIMTPERLDACTRAWRSHWHWIPQVALVVADEIHILGDRHRGARLEGAISRLRRLNPFCRFLCLSATLGNRGELTDWLQGIDYSSDWRPVPLTWRIIRYRKAADKADMLASELQHTCLQGGRSLVFVQSRRRCEALSEYLNSKGLRVQYHHAGLGHDDRKKNEAAFRTGEVDALISTGTLEMGLNLPVRQVLLYDTQFFDGIRFSPLPVNTVWQRAGRAGRPGLDKEGEVVLFAPNWDRTVEQYPRAKFENIRSALIQPLALAEQMIAEIGSGLCKSEDQLMRSLGMSLAVFQGDALPIRKTLKDLLRADMAREIPSKKDGAPPRISITPLGRIACRHMLHPVSVIMIRRLIQKFPEFSFFDALFVLALLPDFELSLPVDFEELSSLTMQLNGTPSHVFYRLQDIRNWEAKQSGKRLLSGLKVAILMLDCCRQYSDDLDTAAEEYGVYLFEISRIKESYQRLLLAMSSISKHFDKKERDEPGHEEDKSIATQKIETLYHMVSTTLPAETAMLASIEGIGSKWARKLRSHGIENLTELSEAQSVELSKIKGLTLKRADKWIKSAHKLLKMPSQQTETYVPLIDCGMECGNTSYNKGRTDPYRARRALELNVKITGINMYLVTGGLEPHQVIIEKKHELCDCMDFSKGNVCKHILAVRIKNRKMENEAEDKTSLLENTQVDLFDLWNES